MNEISMVIMNMESYCWVWVTFKHSEGIQNLGYHRLTNFYL